MNLAARGIILAATKVFFKFEPKQKTVATLAFPDVGTWACFRCRILVIDDVSSRPTAYKGL
jgi:hypothetical protein